MKRHVRKLNETIEVALINEEEWTYKGKTQKEWDVINQDSYYAHQYDPISNRLMILFNWFNFITNPSYNNITCFVNFGDKQLKQVIANHNQKLFTETAQHLQTLADRLGFKVKVDIQRLNTSPDSIDITGDVEMLADFYAAVEDRMKKGKFKYSKREQAWQLKASSPDPSPLFKALRL